MAPRREEAGKDLHRVPELVAELQSIFEARDKELNERDDALNKQLQEREDSLNKQLEFFEEQFPKTGNDSDVLHLNVGGMTNVAVFRRTLTHFKTSRLAYQFCGRMDDSLEKDKDGNFFIDQDPKVFLPLVNFLRQCDQKELVHEKPVPPSPTFDFCFLLQYYGLMSFVYPPEWRKVWGDDPDTEIEVRQNHEYNTCTITTGKKMAAFKLELPATIRAIAYTAEFEKNSCGQVGWAHELPTNTKVGQVSRNSFAFDTDTRLFVPEAQQRYAWSRESPAIIRCTFDNSKNVYSIQVGDTVVQLDTWYVDRQLTPCLSFTGKVTISNVTLASTGDQRPDRSCIVKHQRGPWSGGNIAEVSLCVNV